MMKKSEKKRWYFVGAENRKVQGTEKLTLIFEDDFAAKSLDTSKWITRYFWGRLF
jgi:C4-type Zn-finger protein